MIRKLVSMAILCVLVISLPSYADVLVLNDGREYQGVVLSQDEKIVRFEAHHHGMRMTMNVPRSNIKSIQLDDRSGSESPEVNSVDDVRDTKIEASSIILEDPMRHDEESMVADPIEYHDRDHGYTIGIPGDWEQIPDVVLSQAVNLLLNEPSILPVEFETVFQPKASLGWFESAYVRVQVIPYADIAFSRQPYESEIPQFVQHLSGVDFSEIATEMLSDVGKMQFGALDVDMPTVDLANRQFVLQGQAQLTDAPSFRWVQVGHFGRESLINVYFEAPSTEWGQFATARDAILASFQFEPTHAYDESHATPAANVERGPASTVSTLHSSTLMTGEPKGKISYNTGVLNLPPGTVAEVPPWGSIGNPKLYFDFVLGRPTMTRVPSKIGYGDVQHARHVTNYLQDHWGSGSLTTLVANAANNAAQALTNGRCGSGLAQVTQLGSRVEDYVVQLAEILGQQTLGEFDLSEYIHDRDFEISNMLVRDSQIDRIAKSEVEGFSRMRVWDSFIQEFSELEDPLAQHGVTRDRIERADDIRSPEHLFTEIATTLRLEQSLNSLDRNRSLTGSTMRAWQATTGFLRRVLWEDLLAMVVIVVILGVGRRMHRTIPRIDTTQTVNYAQ